MEPASSLRFAAAARDLAAACRRAGHEPPGFRSPPRVPGIDRSLKRRGAERPIVSVRLGDRPFVVVLADMVEGAVAANGLRGPEAARCRAALWEAVLHHVEGPPVERARVA